MEGAQARPQGSNEVWSVRSQARGPPQPSPISLAMPVDLGPAAGGPGGTPPPPLTRWDTPTPLSSCAWRARRAPHDTSEATAVRLISDLAPCLQHRGRDGEPRAFPGLAAAFPHKHPPPGTPPRPALLPGQPANPLLPAQPCPEAEPTALHREAEEAAAPRCRRHCAEGSAPAPHGEGSAGSI